ncbi:hypothetical protein C354_06769 [Cryptococcus neoformans MW-RSA1955]|nr:hypothetical protein C354_06769 [Cryptococcus neoformans var. grubii MW-RSA1955]
MCFPGLYEDSGTATPLQQRFPEQSSPTCQRDTPDNLRFPNTPSNLRPIQFPYTQADVVPIPGYPGWGRTNWTTGDGNCQFRAFAKALDNGRTSHQEVRRRVAQAMVQWPWRDFISHNYVSQQELEEDAQRLAQDREWGNSTSLWLMGALWEASIAVLHIDAHGSLSWLMGYSGLDDAYLCLAFINGNHYENLLHL